MGGCVVVVALVGAVVAAVAGGVLLLLLGCQLLPIASSVAPVDIVAAELCHLPPG